MLFVKHTVLNTKTKLVMTGGAIPEVRAEYGDQTGFCLDAPLCLPSGSTTSPYTTEMLPREKQKLTLADIKKLMFC